MSDTETRATALSDGSETGVAPPSDPAATCDWLSAHRSGWQFGEQGLLEAIIGAIEGDLPDEYRWVMEFGAGDGVETPITCDRIIRKPGWHGLLVEGSVKHHERLVRAAPRSATVVGGLVTMNPGSTVDDYMEKFGCPETPALMIVDIDGADYYIVSAMKARPYVLCVETLDLYCPRYNDGPFVPTKADAGTLFTAPPMAGAFHLGANAQALDLAVVPMGYTLAIRTRVNSIYVRNDVYGKVSRPPDGKVRINVGAGKYGDPRYVPLDIKTGTDARKLPYADGSVDECYASHILEHFSFYETDAILAEFVRVLKPGGPLRIAVPDMTMLGRAWGEADQSSSHLELAMVTYGGHTDANDIHHNGFTEKSLRESMNRAGIGMVARFDPFVADDCSNHPVSLNLEGIKRWWPRVTNPVVTFIMNQPRFTFTGHEFRMIELAKKCDFNIQPCTGAFWERDNNGAVIDAIRKTDPDFLAWSDYDSIFEADDFLMMLEAIQNDPQMAAIGAVQMSRHNDEPLVFEQGRDYSGDICRVDFQHFGLTIVRREALEELALTNDGPMFWSIPGRDDKGKWDWEQWSRSDGDITFWRNLKMLGFKVCQHNKVCIGHIGQHVKYPRDKGRGVILWPIENYWKHGKPKDAMFNPDLYQKKTAEFANDFPNLLSPLGSGGVLSPPPDASLNGETKS